MNWKEYHSIEIVSRHANHFKMSFDFRLSLNFKIYPCLPRLARRAVRTGGELRCAKAFRTAATGKNHKDQPQRIKFYAKTLKTTPFKPCIFTNAGLTDHIFHRLWLITVSWNTDFHASVRVAIFSVPDPRLMRTFQRLLIAETMLLQKIGDVAIIPIS